MLRYLLRRVALAVPTLLVVAIAVFALIHLIPGDPAQLMLGDMADEKSVLRLREQMHLNDSLPVQFLTWTGHVLRADFGHSITNGLPVLPLILERFQVSASIVLSAVLMATLIAVPAGLVAAWRQNKVTDILIVGAATVLLSLPSFWLGLL